MKRTVVIYSSCFLFVISLHAQNGWQSPACATSPPDFSKLTYEDARAAVDNEDNLIGRGVERIGIQYINNLVHQLQYGHLSNDNKTLAINLLGDLHPNDTNAIEFLIENIDFKATKIEPPTRIVRWGKYPAEEALVAIGKPVIEPILNHLQQENSQLRRQLMCDVLKEVLRKDLAAQNNIKPLDLLKPSDFAKRIDGLKLLKQQRTLSVEDMIAVLDGNFPPDIKVSAAIALGDCRASEAVDALIQNINLDVRGRAIKGLLSEDEANPVSTSLEKIGNPSIQGIIKFLGEKGSFSESGTTFDARKSIDVSILMLKTLCRIDGDKGIVELRLQKALKEETDAQKQARLQMAIGDLEKTTF